MPHAVDIHVGRQLKKARQLRRLSQTDVAKRLSLSFQQIQKYEIGSNRIAASRLFDLSNILDVPTSYFFEGLTPETQSDTPQMNDTSMEIINAVASLQDEQMKARIITFIRDVAGASTARSA